MNLELWQLRLPYERLPKVNDDKSVQLTENHFKKNKCVPGTVRLNWALMDKMADISRESGGV